MKKIFLALVVVGVAGFAGPRPASAQSDPTLVKVPFQFIVGDRLMPAGAYRITNDSNDTTLLTVTNVDGKGGAAFVASDWTGHSTDGQILVQFKSIDGHYFLSQVMMPGGDRQIVFTKASAEKVLAHLNLMPAERADVAK